MKPFDQGWRDYQRGLPPRAYYRATKPTVQYERGRHMAALWSYYLRTVKNGTIYNGTAYLPAANAHNWAFELALAFMPKEMLDVFRIEEQFCSLKSELP